MDFYLVETGSANAFYWTMDLVNVLYSSGSHLVIL